MKKLAPPQTETMLRVMSTADTPQNLEAMQYVVFQFDFKEYEQFIIECPPGSIRFNNLLRVAVFCDNLGFLVENDAVDREAVYELFPIPWVKVEPVIQGMRRELDWPDAFDYFERLGREYIKWWEGKRKRIKPLPPLPESTVAPRALTVARTRPPAPVRPASPPRPPGAAGGRPGMPPRPGVGAVARPGTPPPAAPNKPVLRVLARPALKLGKAIKVVKKERGGKSRGRAKAAARAKPTPKSPPKAKGKRR